MLGDKRVIGVCVTRIQEVSRSDFLNRLYVCAREQQYKLIIYNSFLDFRRQDAFDQGAKSVYGLMDFQVLDVLVIVADSFADSSVVQQLVDQAREHHVPAIVLNGRAEGACCIESDSCGAFKQMIRHVIRDHNAKEIWFAAGVEDEWSRLQASWYREVLTENALPCKDSQIGYDYSTPVTARELLQEKLSGGQKPPHAIICANDYIALAICDSLHECGYHVPQDVIVTGFGGVPTAAHFSPKLSTCDQNWDGFAALTLEAIQAVLEGKMENRQNPCFVRYSESCGCLPLDEKDVHATICQLYRALTEMDLHEDDMYSWIDQVLGMEDMSGLYPALSSFILDDSFVLLDADVFQMDREQSQQKTSSPNDELTMIASANLSSVRGETRMIKRGAIVPALLDDQQNDSLYVISAVYTGKEACGCYVVKTDNLLYCNQKIKRVLKTINIAVNAALNDCRQRNMRIGLENAMLTDTISGLPNVKAAQQWFETFSQQDENRKHTMAITVYGIPKYSYIYEHYGIQDVEELLTFIGKALRDSMPQDSYIAHIADNEFVVIDHDSIADGMEEQIQQASAKFFSKITSFNEQSRKAYYLEVNHGYSIIDPGWSGSLESFVKYAVGEMYLNRMRSGEMRVVKEQHTAEDYYSAFNLLVEKNLFTYHFQPIVDARTGNVYAYEALMRTSGGINMSPLDVLDIARKYGRLYEIEKATLFNVMRCYVERYEEFGGHLLFINTIPGHFLNEEDCNLLMEMYGEYMDHVVFELTEQNTISDHELQAIRRLQKDGQPVQIAVDDYGTGHSNIVNLLRYAPQVIKIDRYLISEIQNDTNKQMFVKNTIEFARLNGIMTLAEGVETFDELQTVIEYGMDLVQGYYLGRPIANPVVAIQDQIKNEIVSKNIRLSKLDSDMRAYTAKDGEEINLLNLAINKFAFIDVFGGTITLVGERDHTVDMVVRVADNVKATLNFRDANFKGATETTVQIGSVCQVTVVLDGENTLHKEGILVPPTSSLHVVGDGNLTILASRNDGVGIGANYNSPYGSLTFDLAGKISIDASGDKVAGIGGGKMVKECIRMVNGTFEVEAKGISVVGVGSASGNADIRIENAHLKVHCAGDEAVSIGSISGRVKLKSTGVIETITDSERAVGIGSLSGRESELHFTRGRVKAINHCLCSTCIGSIDGSIAIYCTGALVDIYGEGSTIVGIGSLKGRAQTIVSGGSLGISFLAGTVLACGNDQCQMTINGGNVLAEGLEINARNLFGMPLYPMVVEGDTFEKQIDTELGSYIYRAQRDEEHSQLCVFLPEE